MIPVALRIALVLVSVWFFCYILRNVKKGKVQIDDTVFWLILAVVLVFLALIPDIAYLAASLFQVQSPINFIYLVIIFILLVKMFTMNIKISQMEIKIRHLVQELAVEELIEEKHSECKGDSEKIGDGV